jgi:hypothetical protein
MKTRTLKIKPEITISKEKRPIIIKKKSPIITPENDDSEMDFGESDFTPLEEQSPMQILNSLQDKENVEMQTEIQQPLNLTRMETLAEWCHDENAFISENTLLNFVNKFRINMVSFNRQSRKEVISALTESIKEERRLSEKLLSVPTTEE